MPEVYAMEASIEDISNDFHEGDILVTEITDPDCEPIMKKPRAMKIICFLKNTIDSGEPMP